ncbi:hypothetical protein ACPZ19_43825 [Amycolatopsis lurida]
MRRGQNCDATEQPAKEGQDKQDEQDESLDAEGLAYWRRACATLPPMTADEIETLTAVLRRIDQRRAQ